MAKWIKIIPIVAIFLITGCATSAKYNKILDTWLGHDVNELVNSTWGYPDSSFVAPNGNKVYVYGYQSSTYIPQTLNTTSNYNVIGNTVYGNSTTNSFGGFTVNNQCTTYFEVDSMNKIVNWKWKGNSCKSR